MFCCGQWIQKVPVNRLVVTDRSSGGDGNDVGKTEDRDHRGELWVAEKAPQLRDAGAVVVGRHGYQRGDVEYAVVDCECRGHGVHIEEGFQHVRRDTQGHWDWRSLRQASVKATGGDGRRIQKCEM